MTADVGDSPDSSDSGTRAATNDSETRPRLGKVFVVVSGALLALPLLSKLPREQALRFEIPLRYRSSGARVERLEVSWERAGDTAAVGGFTQTFAESPPPSVRHVLTVPDGDMTLDIGLSGTRKAARNATESFRHHVTRRVSLEGGEIRISLEGSAQ